MGFYFFVAFLGKFNCHFVTLYCSASLELFAKGSLQAEFRRIVEVRFKKKHIRSPVLYNAPNVRGKLGEISPFKRITLLSDCFLLTLGENTVMFVSPHLHGYDCIIMQLIVNSHASYVIESLLLNKGCSKMPMIFVS